MWLMCPFTVPTLRTSRPAISLLEQPWAMSPTISSSPGGQLLGKGRIGFTGTRHAASVHCHEKGGDVGGEEVAHLAEQRQLRRPILDKDADVIFGFGNRQGTGECFAGGTYLVLSSRAQREEDVGLHDEPDAPAGFDFLQGFRKQGNRRSSTALGQPDAGEQQIGRLGRKGCQRTFGRAAAPGIIAGPGGSGRQVALIEVVAGLVQGDLGG